MSNHLDTLIAGKTAAFEPALAPLLRPETPAPQPPSPSVPTHNYPLTFTGSGSEYFRIWIVNLLLTLVTLTIYSAWAKVRKQQYYYRNTHLDGASFDFHAKPMALLKGRLIALALLGAYSLASYLGTQALLAFGAVALVLAPWLMWRSLKFRLANTSYRAIRCRFEGALPPAYGVFGVMTLLVVAYLVFIGLAAQDAVEVAKGGKKFADTMGGGVLLFILAISPFFYPLWQTALKKYQHNHYHWASLNTSIKADSGDFYVLWFKYIGVSFLIGGAFALVIGIGAILATFGAKAWLSGLLTGGGVTTWLVLFVMGVLFVLGYIGVLAFMGAYLGSRLQNLVWGRTEAVSNDGAALVTFHSTLSARELAWLMTKNLIFTTLTLGLYWPFAAMGFAKLKLEAIEVRSTIPLADIASGNAADTGVSAVGEAVDDVFNLDLAL